jgi:hypothetical protein
LSIKQNRRIPKTIITIQQQPSRIVRSWDALCEEDEDDDDEDENNILFNATCCFGSALSSPKYEDDGDDRKDGNDGDVVVVVVNFVVVLVVVVVVVVLKWQPSAWAAMVIFPVEDMDKLNLLSLYTDVRKANL